MTSTPRPNRFGAFCVTYPWEKPGAMTTLPDSAGSTLAEWDKSYPPTPSASVFRAIEWLGSGAGWWDTVEGSSANAGCSTMSYVHVASY